MKSNKKMKNGILGVLTAMMAMVGVFPLPVYAQSKEAECICEDKCEEENIHEDCEICSIDYRLCEGGEAKETKSEESYGPLTPDGNMNLVDDYGSFEDGGKQFITVTTKSGNFFYLIIDRDDKGNETVHFLNLVDESDLLALMEDEEVKSYMSSHGLTEQEEKTEEPEIIPEETTEEPEKEETPKEKEKGSNATGVMGIVLLLVLGGIGGFMYVKSGKAKKAQDTPDPDMDYFDEEEEDYLDSLSDENVDDESDSEEENEACGEEEDEEQE